MVITFFSSTTHTNTHTHIAIVNANKEQEKKIQIEKGIEQNQIKQTNQPTKQVTNHH